MSQEDKFVIDNYHSEHVSSITYGKKLKPYGKFMIIEVSRYMINSNAKVHDEAKYETLKKVIDVLPKLNMSNVDKEFTKVEKELKVHSPEGIMSYLFYIYQPSSTSNQLIYQLFLSFGKVRRLETISSWYDNFRLNGLCQGYNLVMWKRYDRDGLYTVERNPQPINKSITDINFHDVQRIFVGALRTFIIVNGYYQDDFMNGTVGTVEYNQAYDHYFIDEINPSTSTQDNNASSIKIIGDENTNENKGYDDAQDSSSDDILQSFYGGYEKRIDVTNNSKEIISDEDICDACYEHYPFSFGGAHGCDIFEGEYTIAPNLEQIQHISKHYPSLVMGWILNSATYAGGSGGQHWVAFVVKNSMANLICSQGSNFEIFDDSRILRRLNELGYGKIFNPINIQNDGYSCGIFSAISLYLCICMDCDVSTIIKTIQKNGEGLVNGKDITDFTHVLTGTPK